MRVSYFRVEYNRIPFITTPQHKDNTNKKLIFRQPKKKKVKKITRK